MDRKCMLSLFFRSLKLWFMKNIQSHIRFSANEYITFVLTMFQFCSFTLFVLWSFSTYWMRNCRFMEKMTLSGSETFWFTQYFIFSTNFFGKSEIMKFKIKIVKWMQATLTTFVHDNSDSPLFWKSPVRYINKKKWRVIPRLETSVKFLNK